MRTVSDWLGHCRSARYFGMPALRRYFVGQLLKIRKERQKKKPA